jgi:DNA-binding transcriptional regulator YiaG
MAGQHRRRPKTSPAPLRADEQKPTSLPPQAANDSDAVVPVMEIMEMAPLAEPQPAAPRPSRIQAALRAEMLCRGLRLSQSEFARRYGPAGAIVRNWAPREGRTSGIKV